MNSEFVLNHAAVIAKGLRSGSARSGLAQQIAEAWHAIYQRSITADELQWAMSFATEQRSTLGRAAAKGDRDLAVLTNLCQQLISSNEFLYVD
jgi:hypothetical protein